MARYLMILAFVLLTIPTQAQETNHRDYITGYAASGTIEVLGTKCGLVTFADTEKEARETTLASMITWTEGGLGKILSGPMVFSMSELTQSNPTNAEIFARMHRSLPTESVYLSCWVERVHVCFVFEHEVNEALPRALRIANAIDASVIEPKKTK